MDINIDSLKKEILHSYENGIPKDKIRKETNILNAQYALGRTTILLDILADIDFKAFDSLYEETEPTRKALFDYVEKIYERR